MRTAKDYQARRHTRKISTSRPAIASNESYCKPGFFGKLYEWAFGSYEIEVPIDRMPRTPSSVRFHPSSQLRKKAEEIAGNNKGFIELYGSPEDKTLVAHDIATENTLVVQENKRGKHLKNKEEGDIPPGDVEW